MANLSTFNSTLATDPLRSFRFRAEFSAASDAVFDDRIKTGTTGGWTGGFTNISGLQTNVQSIQYREGGYNTTVHQMPGMTTFSPVTFTRGVIVGNDQAITWMRGLFSAASGLGLNTPSAASKGFRLNINIFVNQHPVTDDLSTTSDPSQMVFRLHNAWITGLSYTDLDATNGAILFETMQVVHEGISVGFTNAAGTLVNGYGASPLAIDKF
jgi:phage tail-like protein